MRFIPLLWLTCQFTAAAQDAPKTDAGYAALEKFVTVLEKVHHEHPDLEKVGYDRLINHALEGLLSSLDPHSSFIHPEIKIPAHPSGIEAPTSYTVPSLGMTLSQIDGKIIVSAVAKNSAASAASVPSGAVLLSINEVQTSGNLSTAAGLLPAQPPGSKIAISILEKPATDKPRTVSLVHRFIQQSSVNASYLLKQDQEVGYLRLTQFGGDCAQEVEKALDDLEDSGMKKLVIDLRDNGGGDLHETVKLLGLFVPVETSVVSVRSRNNPEEFLKTPSRKRRERDYPIAVLVNKNSASASELTAGALMDLERAIVIGEKTYGKGSVQNITPIGAGTALRLTIATYHTPSGNTPHLKGVTPDHAIKFSKKDRENFAKYGRKETLDTADLSELESWIDPALSQAIKELR